MGLLNTFKVFGLLPNFFSIKKQFSAIFNCWNECLWDKLFAFYCAIYLRNNMDLQVLIKVYLQKKKSPRFFKVGHKLVYFDENFKLLALMQECRVKVDQVLLTNACGCYGAVLMRLIPNNLFNSENNFNSNCVPPYQSLWLLKVYRNVKYIVKQMFWLFYLWKYYLWIGMLLVNGWGGLLYQSIWICKRITPGSPI